MDRPAKRSPRDIELERLREWVSELRSKIDELEPTIADLRAQLEQRDAKLTALRVDATSEEDDHEEPNRQRTTHPWVRVKHWLGDR